MESTEKKIIPIVAREEKKEEAPAPIDKEARIYIDDEAINLIVQDMEISGLKNAFLGLYQTIKNTAYKDGVPEIRWEHAYKAMSKRVKAIEKKIEQLESIRKEAKKKLDDAGAVIGNPTIDHAKVIQLRETVYEPNVTIVMNAETLLERERRLLNQCKLFKSRLFAKEKSSIKVDSGYEINVESSLKHSTTILTAIDLLRRRFEGESVLDCPEEIVKQLDAIFVLPEINRVKENGFTQEMQNAEFTKYAKATIERELETVKLMQLDARVSLRIIAKQLQIPITPPSTELNEVDREKLIDAQILREIEVLRNSNDARLTKEMKENMMSVEEYNKIFQNDEILAIQEQAVNLQNENKVSKFHVYEKRIAPIAERIFKPENIEVGKALLLYLFTSTVDLERLESTLDLL